MNKQRTLNSLLEIGIVPIVRTDSAEKALQAAQAIRRGGLGALEVTMTVPKAIQVIEKVADEFGGEMLVGAGSVLDAETARACMLAGAEFFVTPSLNLKTIEMCHRYGKVIMPGALDPYGGPDGVGGGRRPGQNFPCGNVGGPKYIKALKAPLPQVLMVPTGGVSLENTAEFLKAGASAVAVGSELCDKQAMADEHFEVIERKRAPVSGSGAEGTGVEAARAVETGVSPVPLRSCRPGRLLRGQRLRGRQHFHFSRVAGASPRRTEGLENAGPQPWDAAHPLPRY